MMRYPGGKLRLQKKIDTMISEVYPESRTSPWTVGEPFTGGGGSLINMATDFPNWKFRINDANDEVYTFWNFFFEATDSLMGEFYDKIRSTKPTLELYGEIFKDRSGSDFDRAFRILFLNKTSFGGYITQALPIGGKKQESAWKVDEYWTPKNIIKKCETARNALRGKILSVSHLDCNAFVKKYKFDFVYADPPYIKYGEQWYDCVFNMDTLRGLRESLSGKWCVSMDSLPETLELFSKDQVKTVSVKHTAKSRSKNTSTITSAKELVVFP